VTVLSQNCEKWDSMRAEALKLLNLKKTLMMVGSLKAHRMRNIINI